MAVRLQCPACSAIVRISAETAAAYAVVRCAQCKGLVNTAATHIPKPARPRRLRRNLTTTPDPALIAVLVVVAVVLIAGVTLYILRKDRAADHHRIAFLPKDAPPRGDVDFPRPPRNDLPPDRSHDLKSWQERQFLKTLEIAETTATLLSRATTPTHIRNAARRVKVLLDEWEELHRLPADRTIEETRPRPPGSSTPTAPASPPLTSLPWPLRLPPPTSEMT
jgi:predicted Zn finger-like uncharacterized protein